MAVPGLGTIPHLSMAELSQISKVPFNHVPFRGPAESIQMTMGGQIDFAVAPLTAAAKQRPCHGRAVCREAQSGDPRRADRERGGLRRRAVEHRRTLAPAAHAGGRHEKARGRLRRDAKDTEPFQRIVKNTFQPSDYFADSAGFKAHLEKDIAEKRKLLTSLGMVKN